MNTDTTPVQRDRRQAQRGVQCIMVFIQKTSNFIWKHRKHCISAHLSSIAMQNHFPSHPVHFHRLLDHQVAKEALPRRSKVRILAETIKNRCMSVTCIANMRNILNMYNMTNMTNMTYMFHMTNMTNMIDMFNMTNMVNMTDMQKNMTNLHPPPFRYSTPPFRYD